MLESYDIATILIAFFASIVACLQAISAWKQNRQAVRPFLDIDWEIHKTEHLQTFLKLYVENIAQRFKLLAIQRFFVT